MSKKENISLKLLTRESFKKEVFNRDKNKCIILGCNASSDDAHHIIERKLFGESGGYFIDNGASLCNYHHMEVEKTTISCGHLRTLAKITRVIIPSQLDKEKTYDKWGNEIIVGSRSNDSDKPLIPGDLESIYYRKPGPMFSQDNVQKIIKEAKLMHLFKTNN